MTRTAVLRLLCLLSVTTPPLTPMAAAAQEPLPYRNPSLGVAERVADLLPRMTLREKLGQLVMVNVTPLMGEGAWDRGPVDPDRVRALVQELGVGALLSGGGAAPVPNEPWAWVALVDTLQRAAVEESRLGIPIVYGVDAVHGHNNVVGATIFPHNLGLAATWDPDLVREIASRTALDVRSTGIHWNFAPVADLGRDPRWGRFYETFGEAPALVSAMVAASVRGLQGHRLDGPDAVAATVKHFAGYSAPADGRDRSGASIDLRSLREVHFPAFQAGFDAGAATVMVNSGTVNGIPAHASPWLLRTVLREEMGFGGVAVSDWDDVAHLETWYRVAGDPAEAAAMAVGAGVDMIMVPVEAEAAVEALEEAVGRGLLAESRVDEAVGRILSLKLRLGLFERPYGDRAAADAVAGDPHRALSRRAAGASVTLLTNDGALPFGDEVRTVFLGGVGASDLSHQTGGWTIAWQGIPQGGPWPPGTTLREALEAAGLQVLHHPTLDGAAVADLRRADAAVVVLSEPPYAEVPGDTLRLLPDPDQVALLRAAAAVAPVTVAVVIAGRPWPFGAGDLEGVAAVLMAYLPGGEGGPALADILLGRGEPTGRLPFTWPSSPTRAPHPHDRPHSTWSGPEAPDAARVLFPLGHGLSYTRFEHAGAQASVEGDTVRMALQVDNTGQRDGTEVILAWVVGWPGGPGYPVPAPPERRLLAFRKVAVPSGASVRVGLTASVDHLARVGGDVPGDGPRTVTPGRYRLRIGDAEVDVVVGEEEARRPD